MKYLWSVVGACFLSVMIATFSHIPQANADDGVAIFGNDASSRGSIRVASRGNRSFARRSIRSSSSNYFGKRTVSFKGRYRKGSIVIKTSKKKLYYILGGGKAIEYGIGVGRPGFKWYGVKSVSRKAEWPSWSPPPAMRKRIPGLPVTMKGGIRNPLGARALYLGSSIYRIHGTNAPSTIGRSMSSGCIRLLNREVVDLYNRVRIGATVYVQP